MSKVMLTEAYSRISETALALLDTPSWGLAERLRPFYLRDSVHLSGLTRYNTWDRPHSPMLVGDAGDSR